MKNYISIDTGGTFIKHGVIREDGEILRRGKIPTPQTSPEAYFSAIRDICCTYADFHPEQVLSMSLPGTVDEKTGMIRGQSSIPFIHTIPFRELAEKASGMKVRMENDANCAALGETWLGCAKDTESAAFLIFGTGLGGALCLNGKLLRGFHMAAGEFSDYISFYDRNPLRLRNADAILSTRKTVKHIAELSGIPEEELNGEVIFRRAEEQIEPYADAAAGICYETAVLVFNIQHIFDPEVVVLGGGMSGQELWYSQTLHCLEEIYNRTESFAPVRLLRSTMGNNANLLGALRHTLIDRE